MLRKDLDSKCRRREELSTHKIGHIRKNSLIGISPGWLVSNE